MGTQAQEATLYPEEYLESMLRWAEERNPRDPSLTKGNGGMVIFHGTPDRLNLIHKACQAIGMTRMQYFVEHDTVTMHYLWLQHLGTVYSTLVADDVAQRLDTNLRAFCASIWPELFVSSRAAERFLEGK